MMSLPEAARRSPEQALNEIRESVAEELLENLLQVSLARFEVIVLDAAPLDMAAIAVICSA